jgi:hypothetical protein
MAHGIFRTVLAIMLSLPLVAIACLSSPPPLKIGREFFPAGSKWGAPPFAAVLLQSADVENFDRAVKAFEV